MQTLCAHLQMLEYTESSVEQGNYNKHDYHIATELAWLGFWSNLQHQLGKTKIRVSPFISLADVTAAVLGW